MQKPHERDDRTQSSRTIEDDATATKDQPAKLETADTKIADPGVEAAKPTITAEAPLDIAHEPINLPTTATNAAQPPTYTDTMETALYSTLVTSTSTA